jgi:hypothetical protein
MATRKSEASLDTCTECTFKHNSHKESSPIIDSPTSSPRQDLTKKSFLRLTSPVMAILLLFVVHINNRKHLSALLVYIGRNDSLHNNLRILKSTCRGYVLEYKVTSFGKKIFSLLSSVKLSKPV